MIAKSDDNTVHQGKDVQDGHLAAIAQLQSSV